MINVIFVSESTLRGRKRVAAVLDRYATRIGHDTWCTPITQEGLRTIKETLKKIATKQTSVSCFKKEKSGNRLIFSIGKPIIREGDAIYVHKHKKKKEFYIPQYLKDSTIVNRIAGLFHDFGKMSKEFQHKISLTQAEINRDRSQLSDSVRHELISYYMFREYCKNINVDFHIAWANSEREINNHHSDLINNKIKNWSDLVGFIILTHHKLPTSNLSENSKSTFSLKNKNNLSPYFKNKQLPKEKITIETSDYYGETLKTIIKEAVFLMKRIERTVNNNKGLYNDDYWFALSFLCRSHLILSDHEQSGVALNYNVEVGKNNKDPIIYANTHINNKNNRTYYNQTLDWHLKNVSFRSSQLLVNFNQMRNSGLNKNTIQSILTKTENKRFEWQNKNIDFMLKNVKENSQCLILNIAGTGRGKTRANVSILASLNKNRSDNKPLRFSTLLNLKTLTLQTIDAYKEQLYIQGADIMGVIGDKSAINMHNAQKKKEKEQNDLLTLLNNDQLSADDSLNFGDAEIISFDEKIEIPSFLNIKNNISSNKDFEIIMPPVLVSTIDFMINAGDISKQKKHAIPLLRLMNSDLILDEIDSYDPAALAAVSRIIMLAALFGNSVVLSSATLSESCANVTYKAYERGLKLRKAMLSTNNINSEVIILDDKIDISSCEINSNTEFDFERFYSEHLNKYLTYKPSKLRSAFILKSEKTLNGLCESIASQVVNFHNEFKFKFKNKNITFGLVRIANINQAVYLSKYISNDSVLKNKVKICCYHSRLSVLHRLYIEKNLDFILKRGKEVENYTTSELINTIADQHLDEDLIFLVVATPVEEIGRDHDFDWCICEPSSSQSIIQTSGRVNRHREVIIQKPNIAILNYNFKNIKGESLIFNRPGLDENIVLENGNVSGNNKSSSFLSRKTKGSAIYNYKKYASKYFGIEDLSMKNLLDENKIAERLDAALKFEKDENNNEVHLFSKLDNIFMKNQLSGIYDILTSDDLLYHFYNQDFYNTYILRAYSGEDFELNIDTGQLFYNDHFTEVEINKDLPVDNSFLTPENDPKVRRSLLNLMKRLNVNPNIISVKMYKSEDIIAQFEKYFYHPNFGLYKKIE